VKQRNSASGELSSVASQLEASLRGEDGRGGSWCRFSRVSSSVGGFR